MREQVLKQKMESVREDLEKWARDVEILLPGEQIVFELRISPIPLVREWDDDRKSVLQMRVKDFFNNRTLLQRGFEKPMAARTAHAIGNYVGGNATVDDFLRIVSDEESALNIKNIGVGAMKHLLPILEELWALRAR